MFLSLGSQIVFFFIAKLVWLIESCLITTKFDYQRLPYSMPNLDYLLFRETIGMKIDNPQQRDKHKTNTDTQDDWYSNPE